MRKVIAALALTAVAALAAPAFGSGTRGVRIGDNFFSPTHLTISRGTTVRWRWTGFAPHNVVAKRGPVRFHSSTKTHGTYSFRFNTRGSYRIVCTIHGFSMSISVK